MDNFIVAELLTLFLAALAVLIALGRVLVGRLESQNRRRIIGADVTLLRHELETMREKADVQTRDLVNTVVQQCLEENRQLRERIHQNEIDRAEERGTLYTEIEGLRQRLQETEDRFQKRISELIETIRQKNMEIATLKEKKIPTELFSWVSILIMIKLLM